MAYQNRHLREAPDSPSKMRNLRTSEWLRQHKGPSNDQLGFNATQTPQDPSLGATRYSKGSYIPAHQPDSLLPTTVAHADVWSSHSTVTGPDGSQSAWSITRKRAQQDARPFQSCPDDNCLAKFDTVKQLTSHKEDWHDYCRLHDTIFPNHEAFHKHKVESTEHITCAFCSEDFFSKGGRERHLAVRHPKTQNCECPGCLTSFVRASALMNHIESNLCQNITWAQFMKIHMKNSLLAGQVEEKHGEQDDKSKDGSSMRNLIDATETLKLGQSAFALGTTQATLGWEQPIECPKIVVRTEAAPPDFVPQNNLVDPEEGILMQGDGESGNLLDEVIEEEILVRPLKPLADLPADKAARMKRLGRMMWGENALKRINDIVSPQGMPDHLNPFSDRFNVEAFNSFGRYNCPYCRKWFEKHQELTGHMQSPAHYRWDARCPQCFSPFKGAAALISHMESPSFKCKIKESDYFQDALEVATSGFVAHERKGEEHVFKGREPKLD